MRKTIKLLSLTTLAMLLLGITAAKAEKVLDMAGATGINSKQSRKSAPPVRKVKAKKSRPMMVFKPILPVIHNRNKAASSRKARSGSGTPTTTSAGAKVVKKSKPTYFNFEDDTITGTLKRPESEYLTTSKTGKQKSLIKIRLHFVKEILKSAEKL